MNEILRIVHCFAVTNDVRKERKQAPATLPKPKLSRTPSPQIQEISTPTHCDIPSPPAVASPQDTCAHVQTTPPEVYEELARAISKAFEEGVVLCLVKKLPGACYLETSNRILSKRRMPRVSGITQLRGLYDI